jgi:NAD-dependent deacetylase
MGELSEKNLQAIRYAADIIKASRRAVALTGAGISTPSGIPDFRSEESGLWTRHNPFEVASLTAFRYKPENFFDWLRPLALTIFEAQPNSAHASLARLESVGLIKTVITQNIDRLHQRAGSKNVLEVHGTLDTLTCMACFHQVDSGPYVRAYLDFGETPHCPQCGSVLKPDIILFGEQLPARTWLKAMEASKKCDLMIVAGSSLEVLPVAGLPMRAVENGAHLIIINRTKTYIDVRADVVLWEDVAEILPYMVKEVLGD